MRLLTILLLTLITPLLSGAGKVYQSTDAEGNTVFSDMPSAGAKAITVAPANSADPVQDIPALAAPEEREATPQTVRYTDEPNTDEAFEDDSDYWVTNNVDRDDIEEARRERERRRDAPITDRPRVQPLPAVVRPAAVDGGRR